MRYIRVNAPLPCLKSIALRLSYRMRFFCSNNQINQKSIFKSNKNCQLMGNRSSSENSENNSLKAMNVNGTWWKFWIITLAWFWNTANGSRVSNLECERDCVLFHFSKMDFRSNYEDVVPTMYLSGRLLKNLKTWITWCINNVPGTEGSSGNVDDNATRRCMNYSTIESKPLVYR